ncbi:hypothetical protein [Ruminococcus sp.]|uniref:hypothetical protein n=1 Tax=Ruminococcus sp. TaxID=41978 RepID=UPI0025E0145C|nr:hypothetical protein [Ruminococcus sp.]MDD7555136.1 hypothetical protein [Ruminococcus sp.]
MKNQTEVAGIPAYTPVITGSVQQYVYKRKGGVIDREIRRLQRAARNEEWACQVERLAAAILLLPESVTRFCTLGEELDALEEEVPAEHARAREELAGKARELADTVSSASLPELNMPPKEEQWFTPEYCTRAVGQCGNRISWCRRAMEFEPVYVGMSERLRSLVPDTGAFTLAPVVLRAAMVDQEVFQAGRAVLTAPAYDWLPQVALLEMKFHRLSPEEREQLCSVPMLEKLIGAFKTCMAIEDKIAQDPVFGKKVFKEKKRCRKRNIPFLASSIYKQCKQPQVADMMKNPDLRQCTV